MDTERNFLDRHLYRISFVVAEAGELVNTLEDPPALVYTSNEMVTLINEIKFQLRSPTEQDLVQGGPLEFLCSCLNTSKN